MAKPSALPCWRSRSLCEQKYAPSIQHTFSSTRRNEVALTNRPEWLEAVQKLPLGRSTSKLRNSGAWASVDGSPVYVAVRLLDESGWKLLVVSPVEGIFASRVLGIALTLLATIMLLIYVIARERAVHDHVQMDRRLELEELARDLDFKATTDPLTGLSNRLKFDQALSAEIRRARRFDVALSLVIYDVDHFKQINDAYGHQAGDQVLIKLSGFVAKRMRETDLLARWGGEEFVILLPLSDASMAERFAEILRERDRDAPLRPREASHVQLWRGTIGGGRKRRAFSGSRR